MISDDPGVTIEELLACPFCRKEIIKEAIKQGYLTEEGRLTEKGFLDSLKPPIEGPEHKVRHNH